MENALLPLKSQLANSDHSYERVDDIMKRLFYETKLVFRLNPLILDIFSENRVINP